MTDDPDGSRAPYVDIELCFDAGQSQVTLARSVAAEVASAEGADQAYVETVRSVAGELTNALLALTEPVGPVRCCFRVLDSEIRVSVSVCSSPTPSPEAKAHHARLLDALVVPACTFTHTDHKGVVSVVSDAFIPVHA